MAYLHIKPDFKTSITGVTAQKISWKQ